MDYGLELADGANGSLIFRVKQTGEIALEISALARQKLHKDLSGNCPCCDGWRYDRQGRSWRMGKRVGE